MNSILTADRDIDITRDVCPMTFVKTRIALDRLSPGQTLLVRLRGDEPVRNVPRTATEQGHTVLEKREEADGTVLLLIRKGH
jgi:tRNA 2-thiouridine synthesizing protein A